MRNIKLLFYLILAIFCLNPGIAQADNPKPNINHPEYAGKYVSQSLPDPVVLNTGETKTITIKFKNTGTETWPATGAKYVSAYTVEPRDRASVFATKQWKSKKQTAAIKSATKPGATAELVIELKAPAKAGEYREEFFLASESNTWIKDGYFYLDVVVKGAKNKEQKTSDSQAVNDQSQKAVSSQTSAVSPIYKANNFLQNLRKVEAKGGETVAVIVGFQNLGTATWKKYAFVPSSRTALASVVSGQIAFADDSWIAPDIIMEKQAEVLPDGFTRDTIEFRAPTKAGQYTAKFNLKVDDQLIDSAYIEIPVLVTEDAPQHYVEPFPTGTTIIDPAPLPPAYRLATEPKIRVGIWKDPKAPVKFISNDDDYNVFDGATLIGVLLRGTTAVLKYEGGNYFFTGGDVSVVTPLYIRLEPVNNFHAIFELPNYSHLVPWKAKVNFNKYRGAMEYRPTQNVKNVYVINEVLLEDYIAGIAEASDFAPIEYIKALLTAARTYAYYVQDTDKHEKRNFDVVSTTGDQLYLGYQAERISPHVLEAAQATRGYMMTYDKNIVITPYYGHSNGKTKSWKQVWGGTEKPWLQPVVAKYDKGLKQFGHGVGMSQRDAAYRAEKDGMSWQELDKYYYTGIELEKMYQ